VGRSVRIVSGRRLRTDGDARFAVGRFDVYTCCKLWKVLFVKSLYRGILLISQGDALDVRCMIDVLQRGLSHVTRLCV
jgi:hypothetical protein